MTQEDTPEGTDYTVTGADVIRFIGGGIFLGLTLAMTVGPMVNAFKALF